ncbi:unnamed protein product [Urochloa humidicola]
MASSTARHLFLVAVVAALAVATEAWGGGRFFFSKTTRAETAVVEPEKAAAAAAAADTNAAPALSRPSTGGGGGRGYGLYGRPEENYPPEYFRRGVHRNAEKLTTTAGAGGRETVPVAGGVRGHEYPEDGSGRGRPAPTTTDTEEEATPAGDRDLDGVQPYPEDGSGRGRPPWYYTAFRGGRRPQQGQRDDYGMSDTRLYQNGRYYYDVDAGRYGYGRESNPVRTRPEEEYPGSGYGRPAGGAAAAGDGRGRYGENAAARYRQYGGGDGEEFGNNGEMDQSRNGFQEEGSQNGRYKYNP